jgi:hypothetical protein
VLPGDLTGTGGYGFFVNVDAELVDLPLGGVAADDPATAPTRPVVSGELPSGPWSVSTGVLRDPPEPHYVVRLVLPAPHQGMTVAATVEEHLAQSTWQVSSLDGRLVVWGPTPADVTEVVVTSEDGRTRSIPTQPSGVEGFELRIFADDLPEGAVPEAIEGRATDGTTVLRATDLASSLTPIVDFPPGETVSVPVDQLDD